MRVLVVEDDPNLRTYWGAELGRAGHEAVEVDNEPEALGLLQTRAFDLVVLDLCMNGRNALGVATLATYRNPSCKVIVVSGSSVFSRRKLFAMSPAVAAALRKPVDIEDLLEVCSTVVSNGREAPSREMSHDSVEFRS